MITFPGVEIGRDEALRIIATLKEASDIVPIHNGDVTLAHIMAVGMRALGAQLRNALAKRATMTLPHEVKPLRAQFPLCTTVSRHQRRSKSAWLSPWLHFARAQSLRIDREDLP